MIIVMSIIDDRIISKKLKATASDTKNVLIYVSDRQQYEDLIHDIRTLWYDNTQEVIAKSAVVMKALKFLKKELEGKSVSTRQDIHRFGGIGE